MWCAHSSRRIVVWHFGLEHHSALRLPDRERDGGGGMTALTAPYIMSVLATVDWPATQPLSGIFCQIIQPYYGGYPNMPAWDNSLELTMRSSLDDLRYWEVLLMFVAIKSGASDQFLLVSPESQSSPLARCLLRHDTHCRGRCLPRDDLTAWGNVRADSRINFSN